MKRWFYKKETSSKTAPKTEGNTATWTKTWAHLKTCSVGFQIGFWVAFLCLPVLSAFAQQANIPCNSVTSTPFVPPTITGTLSQTTSTAGVGAVYWETSAGCFLGLPLGCGSTRVPANVINSSTTDFARVNLAVGLGLSATMRVTEATNTYSAGNFAGYLIDNASLVSAGLLNAITVKTYNNGTLAETSSSGSLIGVSSSLVAGKYEVGFYTTLPFDAIEVTFNSVAGLAVVYDVYYPVVRKYCAGPSLVCNTKTALNKNATALQSFATEINYEHTGISGIAIATISNPESAISPSTTDFASVLFPVGIGSATLAVKDHFTTYTAGHFAGFDIENVTALGVGLFNSTTITTYLNGVQQETASGGSLAISAGLLSSSGRQIVGFETTLNFDEIKITLNQNGLSLGTTNIYSAVIEKYCAATIACNQTYSLSSPDYPVVIDGGLTGLSGVACVGCSVTNTDNVLTPSTTDYATITVVAGLLSSGSIAVKDALYTYPVGTRTGFTIKDVNSLLQLDLFSGITVSTYNNGVFQESKTANDLLDFALLTNWVGLGSGAYNIGFTATLPFDEIRLSVGSLASALNTIQVYGAYVNTATAYGGTLFCASTFNFNCGTATSTGTFEATGLGGQTGTLIVPITNATAGSAAFTVTGSGFTGELITPLIVGQTSVTIPITFNGLGATGSRTVTVTSASGTGVCTPSITVLVANSGCVLSRPTLLTLGSVLSIPNFCLKGAYNYYKSPTGVLQDLLALNANGNVFTPISVVVDATNTGTHSLTSGGNTTALAQRMISIEAPGIFPLNGGTKVRIYYDSTEFAALPVGTRRWFKHTAHTKAGVLANLTPTGLTNAVFLTPDSIGVENGLSFVEFFNIQSFSTFGYMGSVSPENCTNGIDDDGDGLIDCDDPDCGKPSVSAISKTDPSVSSCPTLNDGSISVTAAGSNLRYSKNGGTNWQVANIFNGLTGGTTTIRIQDSLSTCVLDTAIVLTAPTCVTCATPSVGGTATYSGGTVCSTANMGTLNLSGQTGDVVKWQTSTNGGTSWTDIAASDKPSYSFINAANNQQYRAIVNSGSGCLDAPSTAVTIVTSSTACTTSTCSYTSGTFAPSVSVSPNPIYTTHVVLVNPTTGVMTYVTAANTTAFTGVAVGDYVMYVLSYDTTQTTPPTITAGLNISTLTGCFSVSDPLLTKVCCPTIAAPTVSITQPACGGTTGTITVTAPSTGVTYSFDNGTNYQASATSSALAAGATYQVLVKDNSSNCVSTATPSVINAILAVPTAPTTTIVQPTCSVSTGTITVTAPATGVTYSFDNGTNFQASATSAALASGTYQVIVKDNTSLCTSTTTSTTINAQPATPVISSIAKTDASLSSCPSLNDGTITVTATGANLQYSIDNGVTYQASNSFTGLVAGSYTIKVKDNVSTCELAYTSNPVVLTAPVCNVAPVITSAATATTPENVATTTPVYTATATDPNSGQTQAFSFETGGADNALFTINPTTGAVTFNTSPDFETPTDAGGNNVYDIKIKVCDNGSPVMCATKDVAIAVTDAFETCPTPSVGGTASYTGGTVCSTSNMGTIVLTGQTGGVAKWQTSTNNGTSWTDIAGTTLLVNYNFINAANGQQYRAVVNSGNGCTDAFSSVVTIATSATACTTTTCSYNSSSFNPTISTSSNPSYTTHVVLVNPTTGVMDYVTAANSTAFTGVALGDYVMYVVTYDNTVLPIPTITVGTNITALTGCTSISDPLLTKVCCPTIAAPTATVSSQPTCTTATASVSLSGLPSTGTWTLTRLNTTTSATYVVTTSGSGSTFSYGNVPAGTYTYTVKDNANACASTASNSITVNAQPVTPVISGIAKTDVSLSSCPSLNDGAMTVTATGSNLEYSKDNGATWQVSNQFTGLTAGSYTIKVKDNVSTCEVAYTSNPVVVTAPVCNVMPVITSTGTATTPESVTTTTAVYTATATDANAGQTQTYSFETGGVDNGKFTIDPTTGEVKFITSPDFEIPTDAGGNNVYDIKIKVCDNGTPVMCTTKDVAITITNVVEPEICGNQLDDDGDGKIDGEDPDCTEPACSNTTGIITATITGQNTGVGYTQKYVLTDSTGKILQIVNTPSVSGLVAGKYRFYGVNYETASGVTGLTVNQNINGLTGMCVNTSLPLLYKICPPVYSCNNATGTITATITNQNTDSDYTQSYVLTDSSGVILQLANTPSFTGLTSGKYQMYAINYKTIVAIVGLTIGQNITSLTGSCLSKSTPLLYQVCFVPEICNNRIDDDGDGLIDCEDVSDCTSCGCDNTTGDITFTNTGQSTTGYTQVYVLTDSTGKILTTNTAATFTGLSSGRYRVYAINYRTTDGITGITIGGNISGVTGTCFDKSLPLLFKVCLCVTFNFKAILEGPYQTATQTMHTTLNQRGLLPGQTPIGQFAVQTPQGQPYKGLPWNYAGTEGDTITTYPATVVDWVLVSLRLDSTTNANAFRVTGWLHNDGHISFITPCFDLANGAYFVVIEHRNHIGVMSPQKVFVQNGTMAQDFTLNDGYVLTNPPSFGQKQKGSKWVLFAGDGKKDTYTTNFDINFNDSQLWKAQSGIFDQYKQGDFDMNADVNFLDNYLWKSNSGKYSGVPH